MMTDPIHIVTSFDGIGGTEAHARRLADVLAPIAAPLLWSVRPGRACVHYRAQPISPFGGQMPRGGTLILLGTHFDPGIWLDYVRPKRLIVICNLLSTRRTMAFLSLLERPSLPRAELVFVSNAVRSVMALPGRICPPLIDLERFHPSRHVPSSHFRVGRHSRDDAAKHHGDDPALYRILSLNGIALRLMGATVLQPMLAGFPNLELLPVGAEAAENFLGNLDLFLYRTPVHVPEASGRGVIEALASGLPVIAHANGGYAEWIVSGENGHLFTTQEEVCEQVRQLAAAPSRVDTMRRAARQTAERLAGGGATTEYLNWLAGEASPRPPSA